MTTKQHGGLRNPPGGRPPKAQKVRRLHVWVAIETDAEEATIKALTPAERRTRLLTPTPGAGPEQENTPDV